MLTFDEFLEVNPHLNRTRSEYIETKIDRSVNITASYLTLQYIYGLAKPVYDYYSAKFGTTSTAVNQEVSQAEVAATTQGMNKTIKHPVLDNTRTGSALKQGVTDPQHGFNDIIDNYSQYAEEFTITGGDGVQRKLYQIEGGKKFYEYKTIYDKTQRFSTIERTTVNQEGVFEWIVARLRV